MHWVGLACIPPLPSPASYSSPHTVSKVTSPVDKEKASDSPCCEIDLGRYAWQDCRNQPLRAQYRRKLFKHTDFSSKTRAACLITGNRCSFYHVSRKHNPFISFTSISGNPARCAKIVPATQLDTDIANNALPNYSFYTPNLVGASLCPQLFLLSDSC